MPKSSAKNTIPPCGCGRTCRCRNESRCRCHDYNALLALTLWDYGRAIRRQIDRSSRSRH